MTNNYPLDLSNFKFIGRKIHVSAPGKVILNGEHSVVYGKLALAASIGLRSKVEINEIDLPNTLVVQFDALKFTFQYDIQKIKEVFFNHLIPLDPEDLLNKVDNFIKFTQPDLSATETLAVKAFFYLLIGILGSSSVQLTSLLVTASTELNAGAGLGSSASFTVCLSAALLQLIKSKIPEESFSIEGYKSIRGELNLIEFNKQDLDWICQWSYRAEKIIHGTPSGVDNTVCTFGSVVEYRKGSLPKLIEATCPLKLLLINSNVPRETKKMVAKVAEYRRKYPMVLDHLLESMDQVATTVVDKISELSQLSDTDDTTEIYESLAELFTINHNLLNSIGVGHNKLNKIVDILAEHGLSGKLTGGGGGGYAICLIPPKFDAICLGKTVITLKSHGFDVVETKLGVEGVTLDIFA
ncbi:mevalonate kinase [Diabrotica virgifera virgifera]|uniref:Mevalonate kinase n=1 Tax=Diabrotica virgifera virgifera TaxID=50390 RepID=A0A6P7GX15_DIAVI|nr:mevalonate kinase [Diabrotica virgifera virgifera]